MNKIILVTGGNRGIGLEICRQLSEKGHRVILASRDLKKGEEAASDLKGDVTVKKLDVTSGRDLTSLSEYIGEKFGHLDVLINNAGIMSSSNTTAAIDMKEVEEVMDTNFYSVWRISQRMIPLLDKSSDGRIINMSSGMGALDDLTGGYSAYRISKTSLNALTLLMANELKGRITVNAMCPGWVNTDMGGKNAPHSVEKGADTAVWLALEEKVPTGKFFRDRKIIKW